MRIIGTGIDIVQCARIEAMIQAHGDGFLRRVYTEQELAYCRSRNRQVEHLAARWAAKEAVLKALGTGWTRGLSFTDVEVVRQTGGLPQIVLHAAAAQRARQLGVTTVQVSLSHCRDYAVAHALALADTPPA